VVSDEYLPYAPYPSPTGTARRGTAGAGPPGHGTGPWFLARANLGLLLDILGEDGRTIIGPTVLDGAVVYAEITSEDDLPAGIGDEQSPGHYRLVSHGDRRVFDYTVGPLSPKRWTFPPIVALNVGRREGRAVSFEAAPIDPPKLAFFGVRACELAALGIQDRVFLGGPYTDEDYRARRRNALVVAGQLHHLRLHLLLHLDGHRTRGSWRLRPRAHGARRRVRGPGRDSRGADLIARLPLRGADAGQMFRAAEEVGKVAATIATRSHRRPP